MNVLCHSYTPLKWGEIRLVELACRKCFCYICGHNTGCFRGHPDIPCPHDGLGQTAQELTGRLVTYPLRSAPDFVALSYVWGNESNRRSLVLRFPRRLLSITRNCHEALTRLWKLGLRYIWVDAVCINQQDVPERNAQVAIMSKIYSSANRVIVYLGNESDDSSVAIEYLKSHEFAEGPKSAFPQRTRAALTCLFQRPWFSRIWILQEVNAAQSCEVVCGNNRMAFFQFHAFYMHNIERDDPLEEFPYSVARYTNYSGLTEKGAWSAKKSLLHLLCATRHCGATDLRDKYYALLSLINDRRSEKLAADYSKKTLEVYTDLAIYILQNVGLSLLCAAGGQPAVADLPSWIPDWSINCGRACSVLLEGDTHLGFAAGGKPMLIRAEIPQPLGGSLVSELRVIGFRLGLVAQLGNPYNRKQQNFEQAVCTWQQFYCLQKGTIPVEQQESVLQGFSRTISFSYAHKIRDVISWTSADDRRSGRPIFSVQSPSMHDFDNESKGFDGYRSRNYCRKVQEAMHNRRLFRTEKGDCGMGPEEARVDDVLCIFLGAPVPFLVRPCGGYYSLVGECCVDGIMDGDMIPDTFDYEFPETHRGLLFEEFVLR